MPVLCKMAGPAMMVLLNVAGAAAASISATYSSTTGQTMDGFGVSQAFGRASEFKAMNPTPRAKALDYLFSTETGAGLTMIRNRIGSGGSGDSIEPQSPGCPTCTPNYVWNGDDSGQVWFSKQALSYGVSVIYADAWSAPGFMKTNGEQANGGYLCGVTGHSCSSGDWRQAYADFLVQYVKFYAQEGIQVTHLGFLNEPDYTTGYSSMRSNGAEAASFIPILSDTVRQNNLDVTLTCCDAVGWDSQSRITADLVSASQSAFQDLGVITSHGYSSPPDGGPMSSAGNLPTWLTEDADLDNSWSAVWYQSGAKNEGMYWADRLAKGIVDAHLSAYIYWEGVEVNQYQAASYLVASDGSKVEPSGRLWAFAMWSRFVRPGAQRLQTSGDGSLSHTRWAAFKNTDGSVVAVFTNNGNAADDASLSVSGFSGGNVEAWITNNSNSVSKYSVTAASGGGGASFSVPARSVVTVRLSGGSSGGGDDGGDGGGDDGGNGGGDDGEGGGDNGGGGGCTSAHWEQCGGQGFTGCTTCASGLSCNVINVYYSQCL